MFNSVDGELVMVIRNTSDYSSINFFNFNVYNFHSQGFLLEFRHLFLDLLVYFCRELTKTSPMTSNCWRTESYIVKMYNSDSQWRVHQYTGLVAQTLVPKKLFSSILFSVVFQQKEYIELVTSDFRVQLIILNGLEYINEDRRKRQWDK